MVWRLLELKITKESMSKNCTHCLKGLEPDTAFCGHCGTKVSLHNDLKTAHESRVNDKSEIDTFPKFILLGLGPILAFGALMFFITYITTPEDEWVTASDLQETRANQPQYFYGYRCTDDCSGHQAGYDWARRTGVYYLHECRGNSQSFIEGCKAWVKF